MRRRQRWAQAKAMRALLAARFPEAFTPSGTPFKRPLKRGIHLDLMAALPGFTRQEITNFLTVYTSGVKYQEAMIAPRAVRLAPDGEAVGFVSEKDRTRAANILRRIKRKRA